ncbi:hypothetical protein HK098_002469 [Nowakowskiella sp. JEL0407]|nr:hypothetical protein HK098_002469 [Nowakowskiella sp. JEL0407]
MAAYGPQRKDPSEIMRGIEATPLFMDSLPEDASENAHLAALQSLVFEGPPNEVALNFKNSGNEAFQSGKSGYKDAIEYYSKGIAAKADDDKLNSILYSNRAAVNLELENYRSVLTDCSKAIKLDPKNIKAYYRSAKALTLLDKIDDAIDCIHHGLKLDPTNTSLLSLLSTAKTRKLELENKEAKKVEAEKEKLKELQNLVAEILKRNIKMIDSRLLKDTPYSDTKKITVPTQSTLAITYTSLILKSQTMTIGQSPYSPGFKPLITFDKETKTLSFPCMFLYPEFGQHDCIASVNERDTFFEHLSEIFAEKPYWDTNGSYTPDSVEVYVETLPKALEILNAAVGEDRKSETKKSKLLKIGKKLTVGSVLEVKDFVVVDCIPVFFVVVAGSEFEKTFKEKYKKRS